MRARSSVHSWENCEMKKKILHHVKVLEKGAYGIGVELIYPIVVSFTALILCAVMYVIFSTHP